jgi:hypothetical protein
MIIKQGNTSIEMTVEEFIQLKELNLLGSVEGFIYELGQDETECEEIDDEMDLIKQVIDDIFRKKGE